MTDEKTDLLQQALKRRERLLAMRKKTPENKGDKTSEDVKLPAPKFRSYKPQDEGFKENVLEDAKAGDVQSLVQDQLNLAKEPSVIEELDIHTLEPQKLDADLKRNCAMQLEKLQRKTQKAIAELIRERLKQTQDLAAVVNVGANYQNESNVDD